MSKNPNYFAMTLPELLEYEEREREANEKLLKKQKRLKKTCDGLGKAQKATSTVATQTGPKGLFRGLLAKLAKKSEA